MNLKKIMIIFSVAFLVLGASVFAGIAKADDDSTVVPDTDITVNESGLFTDGTDEVLTEVTGDSEEYTLSEDFSETASDISETSEIRGNSECEVSESVQDSAAPESYDSEAYEENDDTDSAEAGTEYAEESSEASGEEYFTTEDSSDADVTENSEESISSPEDEENTEIPSGSEEEDIEEAFLFDESVLSGIFMNNEYELVFCDGIVYAAGLTELSAGSGDAYGAVTVMAWDEQSFEPLDEIYMIYPEKKLTEISWHISTESGILLLTTEDSETGSRTVSSYLLDSAIDGSRVFFCVSSFTEIMNP